ncbi:MAG: VanZ family protein [Planctomycetaceae bacterium]|nr:VanZ family protein [Planctomycetaceae bacterium]
MTEPTTLTPRRDFELRIHAPEPQVRITVARKERLRRRFARKVAAWAGVILVVYWLGAFTMTHLPMPKEARLAHDIPHADKIVHLTIYTGLSLLLSVWFGVRKRLGGAVLVAAAVLCLLAGYAAFDELSQSQVGRTPDLRDWFADVAGIHLGLVGFISLRSWVRR